MKLLFRWRLLILGALALVGLLLRLYGLNWDAGNNFHPDERQILFVVTALGWPNSWAQFFDPVHSPLNPHFFAYGSFPIYLIALIGHLCGLHLHDSTVLPALTLVGRAVSALFDSGTIVLTGCLALVLSRRTKSLAPWAWMVAYLAATLLVFTPLDIQLAHFYTVDTLLAFFVVLTLLACVKYIDSEHAVWWFVLAGIAYGLALATKFSAAPLAVPFLVACYLRWRQRHDIWNVCATLLLAVLLMLIVFVLTQPYALLDMSNYVRQVAEQGALARGDLDLPYVRQFVGTTPFVYEAQNMVLWGMGVTLGCTALAALLWFLVRIVRSIALTKHIRGLESWGPWLVMLSWILVYGSITGSFFVKFMRYMLPLYPPLIILGSAGLVSWMQHLRRTDFASVRYLTRIDWVAPVLRATLLIIVIGGTIFQGLALLNVYSQPNTRIQASRWIYQNVSVGRALTYEQWDDALPYPVGQHTPSGYVQVTYTDANGQLTTGMDLYDPDTLRKAQQLSQMLNTADVIAMPTDRLDKSIPRSPQRYPLALRYYQLLYSGQLGFRLAAQFEVHPNLLGITLDDSNADESYSVFDHPHARIFVRDHHYSAQELDQMLIQGLHLPPD